MSVARAAAMGTTLFLLIGAVGYSALTRAEEPRPAYGQEAEQEHPPIHPAEVEGSISLDVALEHLLRCRRGAALPRDGCAGAVYIWSPLMPLSRDGVVEARQATDRLGVELTIIDGSELERWAASPPTTPRTATPEAMLAAEMVAAGATVHYPTLLVHHAGRFSGAAILGYKVEHAYRALIDERLHAVAGPQTPSTDLSLPGADTLELAVEYRVSGRPGAYFRSVPGRQVLAYESGSTIHLLDLTDGSIAIAPGTIDFVPTPDGRLFVTPDRNRGGLEFYDAAEVFARARRGAGTRLTPVHVDRELRDQYPSVGILRSDSEGADSRTVYRVLTSWFDRIALRDYEVRRVGARGQPSVRALGPRRFACPRVSIPILSPDGRLVAGRDEESASTKIYRIGEGSDCQEVADLEVQSGKVAWSPDATRLAFAIPRGTVRDGSGPLWTERGGGEMAGIFVYDRSSGEMRSVPESEDANRLTFPDFVGSDSLVFLLSPQEREGASVFRLVCCVREAGP